MQAYSYYKVRVKTCSWRYGVCGQTGYNVRTYTIDVDISEEEDSD